MPKKRVWRICDRAPLGEWVEQAANAAKPGPSPADLPEVSTGGGWLVSSFDLLHGTDVNEGHDTVPAELFDAMFPPVKAVPKPKG